MTGQERPREAVRKFFDFDSDVSQNIPWERPGFWAAGIVGLLCAININFIVGLVIGCAIAGGVYYAAAEAREAAKTRNENTFEKLAHSTSRIQAQDAIRAILRIFDRTQLNRTEVRPLEGRYLLQKERQLFDEEETEAEKLGDLLNKSIRLFSAVDTKLSRFRSFQFKDGHREDFFNPMRIASLYMTPSELVVCDSEIDSITGGLKEKVTRIMLTDIVSIGFASERARIEFSTHEIEQIAKDLKLNDQEAGRLSKFATEDVTSKLEITRTDGGNLQFPMKRERTYGIQASALDQETPLTDDEVTIDRMVNELNRVVRGSRGRPSGP